jgi:hypothetical protein
MQMGTEDLVTVVTHLVSWMYQALDRRWSEKPGLSLTPLPHVQYEVLPRPAFYLISPIGPSQQKH